MPEKRKYKCSSCGSVSDVTKKAREKVHCPACGRVLRSVDEVREESETLTAVGEAETSEK